MSGRDPRLARGWIIATALWIVLATAAPSSGAAQTSCPADRPLTTVAVSTVPVVPGARIDVAGEVVTTDRVGRGQARVCRLATASGITGPTEPVQLPERKRAVFDRVFLSVDGRSLQAAFGIEREVSFAFAGLPTKQVESFVLRSSTGEVIRRTTLAPVYLPATRVLRGANGLQERQIYYSVDSVSVAGSSVVNRSQVKFYPADRPVVRIPLLAYTVRVEVVDRLFGWPTGSSVKLARDGASAVSHPLENGVATITEVPRGDYQVVADAPGLRIDRRLVLSRDQLVVMPVLTWLDLGVLLGVPAALALGLVLAPRPLLRRRLGSWVRRRTSAVLAVVVRGPPSSRRH